MIILHCSQNYIELREKCPFCYSKYNIQDIFLPDDIVLLNFSLIFRVLEQWLLSKRWLNCYCWVSIYHIQCIFFLHCFKLKTFLHHNMFQKFISVYLYNFIGIFDWFTGYTWNHNTLRYLNLKNVIPCNGFL